MSSLVPNDWDFLPLQNVFTLTSGKAKTKKNLTSKSQENPVPVFGGNGINGYCSEAMLTESTVVIGRVGEYCGVVHLSPEISWMTDNALYVKKLNVGFDKSFIFYQLTHASLDKLRSKGGQPLISQTPIYELSLGFPPFPEQQKIAKILTSVDEVIEKTQAQIDKLKDLKIGMMQELLTNGIGHTEFKDSPVGRIPAEWGIVTLGELGAWKGGGTPSKANKGFWTGNIPWVSPKDMKTEYITKTKDAISEEAIKGSSTNLVDNGSILIVVRSGILQHTLPVAIAANELTINQDMKALTLSEKYYSKYIYHYLTGNNHKVLRATLKAGNTVESIDFAEFSKYKIPYPPLTEQIKIGDAVESVAINIRNKEQSLKAYKNSKKALMQDLLTGKVRVKVDS
ncbi:restriction endonuclease subunit S [Colwellia sp. Arc7-635]|uniref:restriction endonuclease subunit S n=1 Tax=Colwellia sp. Arc7-635 TaxID=2497879 RepID=UPI000F84F556|nr:restriction endonuclease subunit S [Colwellia sp. Arc7-635]AZQ85322.1 restriction endonuclease subunit S [Colwellia sp. Arc7-635]